MWVFCLIISLKEKNYTPNFLSSFPPSFFLFSCLPSSLSFLLSSFLISFLLPPPLLHLVLPPSLPLCYPSFTPFPPIPFFLTFSLFPFNTHSNVKYLLCAYHRSDRLQSSHESPPKHFHLSFYLQMNSSFDNIFRVF